MIKRGKKDLVHNQTDNNYSLLLFLNILNILMCWSLTNVIQTLISRILVLFYPFSHDILRIYNVIQKKKKPFLINAHFDGKKNKGPEGKKITKELQMGFPGGTVVENLPANAGDTGSSPGLGRSHMPWSN